MYKEVKEFENLRCKMYDVNCKNEKRKMSKIKLLKSND
jgi:hypothetical protein